MLLANALAMRWASSKAWIPEKTELLVVVARDESLVIVDFGEEVKIRHVVEVLWLGERLLLVQEFCKNLNVFFCCQV